MPRTKVRRQNVVKSKLENEDLRGAKKYLAECRKEALDKLESEKMATLEFFEKKFIEDRMHIVKKYNNRTLSQLENLKSFSSLSTIISGDDTTSSHSRPKLIKRSSSCAVDDEGYNTTESTNSGPRASRGRAKKATHQSRMTRSLSRTTHLQPPTKPSNYNTPINKGTPPNSYGMITPKVKPNTPMVILRRPKMGEVAISMQGSPLMTAPVVTDHSANINIPLEDGTLMSLQAQRGLRKSQIPELDPEVKRQLQMLRENLNLIL